MARILNNTNHLNEDIVNLTNEKRKRFKTIGLLFLGSLLVLFLSFFIPSIVIELIEFIYSYVFIIGISINGYKAGKISRELNKIDSGVKGEKLAIDILSRLPDTYSIITDLQVSDNDGRISQIDSVVIGNNGIFIIEVKNMNGEIVGNSEDKEFTQYKTGRKGGEYSNKFYNPIKQVRTHTYRLSQFLKRNGLRYNIKDFVLFTNSNAKVLINNSTTTNIFSISNGDTKELINHILNNNEVNISNEDKEKIENLLIQCVM